MTDRPAERPTTTQHLSAVLALAALAGTALVLVGALYNRWDVLLVSLLALSAAVVGSWYVLSRRGTKRLVAAAVVVAGLAVFVGVLLASRSVWVLAVTLLLAAASVAATAAALPVVAPTSPAGPAAPKPVRPVLLMNPRSGGGKAEKFDLPARCRERGIEPIVLQPGDDLLALAEDAVARGADVIGMAGGDGSQALVASVASKHGVPHVVVPAGTRNHFALDLGLDRDDVVGALDAFGDGVERVIDLAEVNGRVFVNNASMGVYAKVVQSAEYRDAKIATAADVLPDILGPDAVPLDLRFTLPSGEEADTAQLILVSNNAYELHRLRGAGTRARVDGGVLGVASVRVGGAMDVEKLVALEAVGQVQRFSGWQEWTTATFEVRSDGPVEIGVDGEALSLDPPLRFTIRAGALRIRLPRAALGLSPAAQRPRRSTRETVPDLVKVALGHAVGTS
jgi:diacylglycerol kinase family enzyme